MAKPITQQIVDEMDAWFEKLMAEFEAGDEYVPDGPDMCMACYLTIESSPFAGRKWDFCPDGDKKYDIYELLSLLGRFEFEEEGGPAWYVSRRTE